MLIYIVRRLLTAIPVLLAATMFVFLLVDLSGDPLSELKARVPPPSEEQLQAASDRLYEDRSTPERYWLWVTGVGDTNGDIGLIRGEWGPSNTGTEIGSEVGRRFFNTVRLVLAAGVLALVLAVVAGVVSAVRQYSRTDHTLTFLGFLALAMPVFWLAALVKETGVWINGQVGSRLFYTIGATSPNYESMPPLEKVGNIAGHLILPTLVLMLISFASISRFQRAAMLEVINSDYVRLARAKGLRNRVVMRKHALRTALIPVVTLGALLMSGLLTGTVITEVIFQWRGLGTYLVESVVESDVFSVMAFLLIAGSLVVVANLVADVLYGVLDPRIRYE